MKSRTTNRVRETYSLLIAESTGHEQVCSNAKTVQCPDELPSVIQRQSTEAGAPPWLSDLTRIESAIQSAGSTPQIPLPHSERAEINPTLHLLELAWRNLPLLTRHSDERRTIPEPGNERVLVWRHPGSGEVRCETACDSDLLALKMVLEEIEPTEVANAGNVPVGAVNEAIRNAAKKGVVLLPPSRIRRDPAIFEQKKGIGEDFLTARAFTLQWHITQECDLHCAHCYDRSDRSSLRLGETLGILEDLHSFCMDRRVKGQVSFSGGNPLLYPHFTRVYRAAADYGFTLAILGNPSPRERIEELIKIQMPAFYQISLEGLPEHNNRIRGEGHFDRSVRFLWELRSLGVSTMVMLTLTKDNIDQVIPLAHMLRGLADNFHFNRLSMVGEGANLALPSSEKYRAFLGEYLGAAADNPIMGIKDNLINIIHHEQGLPFFGGCTGFGCGAAFNFISLLSDGEAHACRKFPSPIGNVLSLGIAGVYDSYAARHYRGGCSACSSCEIRPVCGGCLAITHSHGIDPLTEKDPFCFISQSHASSTTLLSRLNN